MPYQSFLQIAHISDLHLVDRSFPRRQVVAAISQLLLPLHVWPLNRWLLDGTAPADSAAVDAFEVFLQAITVDDPEWSNRLTWLVDSGDLTTFGDPASFAYGAAVLQRFGAFCQDVASIHGNHDAWPETLPLMKTQPDIDAHTRQVLGAQPYPVRTHKHQLSCSVAGVPPVLLNSVDSVLDRRWDNTLAFGEVDHPQLSAHATDLDARVSRSLRILAIHHPVHYAGLLGYLPWPVIMRLRNDMHVGQTLATGTPAQNVAPRAHVVLSGHTHDLFPGERAMPSTVTAGPHAPLGNGQAQLVVGSLSQEDHRRRPAPPRGKPPRRPHQAEILRFLYDPLEPDEVVMQRWFAARTSVRLGGGSTASGPFEWVTDRQGPVVEELTIRL